MNDDQVSHAMSIADAYRVERVLARGEGGVTELVTIDEAGPFVRKKMPRETARRVIWSALADCTSSRLPHVEATYETPDDFVVVYDFVPGATLEHHVAQNGPLSIADACQVARTVCEGAADLHVHGIVHRDLSPANVVIAADGAHIIDLGIARMRVEGATKDTTSLGTWGYASPEQYGFAQTDARSDVYSIGRLTGFMITGTRPDADDFEQQLVKATANDTWLRAVIARACAFEPSMRYQSADELAQALSGPVQGADSAVGAKPVDGSVTSAKAETAPARPAVSTDNGWEPADKSRGNRRAIVIGIIVALLALAVAAAAWFLSQQTTATDSAQKSGDTASSTSKPAASGTAESAVGADALQLVESGWYQDSNGYVHYAVALKNADASRAISFPKITITGRKADGSVAFANEQVFNALEPGETATFAGLAGNGTIASTVQIEVEQPTSDDDFATASTSAVFDINNTRENPNGTSSTFTGEVATVQTGDDLSWSNSVYLSVVLRDDAGNIVGGEYTFVDLPAQGESAAFSLDIANVPEHASYEIYARAW